MTDKTATSYGAVDTSGFSLRRIAGIVGGRNSGLVLAIAALLVVLAIKSPSYLEWANLKVVALQLTTVGILSVGTTFLLISGNIDLSIGSSVGLVAVLSAILSKSVPIPIALALGVVVAVLISLVNGLLVWRINISPIIITLGSLTLVQGAALLISRGVGVPNVPASFASLGRFEVFGFSTPIIAFVVIAVLAGLFLSLTVNGRHLYAVGGNAEASGRVGIRVRRIVLGAFLFNGLLVGIAAVLMASRFGSATPSFGLGMELMVITAVILGGVAFSGGEGGLGGVVLAVIFLGILNSGMVALGIDPYYTKIVQGGALIVAISFEQLALERRERRRKALAVADRASSAA